ncbi:MAG: hypothetical protein KC613_25735, partial [Myxococcales bacterium]|nr:hypothetical protein [Myxococcales bacterium]
QRWSAFRRGRIPWAEFEAALASVQTGSWRWESVQAACPRGSVCYPFSVDRAGVRPFTSDQASVPVPSGVVEMPFAATLRQPDPQGQPGLLTGRIDSSTALHYAGFPALSLEFSGDPTSCHREVDGVCLSFVQAMDAQVVLGGRQAAGAGCGRAGYRAVQVPWLVPGFAADSVLDPAAGLRATTECRDETLPFQLGLDPEAERQANLALAAANPIPDGRARRRTLTLVDGALINQSTLFILFQERFDSFLDPADAEGFGSYGMLLLRREPADLDPADADGDQVPDVYQGSAPEDGRAEPQGVLQVSCDPALVAEILDGPEDPASDPDAVALTLLDGVRPGLAGQILDADSLEQPHYLCVDTGLFDGGPENTTPAGLPGLNDNSCGRVNGVCEDGGDALAFVEAVEGDQRDAVQIRCALGTDLSDCGPRFTDDADVRVGCPEGSEVLYFTVDASRLSQQAIADHPCQQTGTCADTLRTWQANRGLVRQLPARWQCADEARVYCSDDRGNLREGKRFFAQDDDAAVFEPLAPAIDRAFRYKTRFRNREGRALGFAPEICAANSDQTPYCYDPAAIEALAARVDCLIDLHLNHDLSAPVAARVARYLDGNFSYVEEPRAELAQPLTHDGFERLHTELLVMLGDDQLTRAFASRF